MFNQKKIEALTAENQSMREELQQLRTIDAMEVLQLQQELQGLRKSKSDAEIELSEAKATLDSILSQIVETDDILTLQEVGVYNFSHVLDSAVHYQDALKELQDRIKSMNRANGGAVTGSVNFTLNNSKTEGAKMVKETSKLMLRAYNGEVDDAVRCLKAYKIATAIERLEKVRSSIEKLGKSMSIAISPEYHKLRISELKLTADFLQKQAEQKEQEKAERERLREEAKAQKEFEAEKSRLLKEQSHYENLLAKALENENIEAQNEAKSKIEELQSSIKGVEERSANIRAGYVYVISNIGSFGEDIVKIGLTRRLDYQDRIHELSNASVPFVFDIHAVIFSNDAVSLEHQLHQALEGSRVNRVNPRKEYFRVSVSKVKDKLEELAGEHILVFNEIAEAAEWRMSQSGSQKNLSGADQSNEDFEED